MKNIAGSSSVRVEAGGESLISTSGASLLMQTAAVSGLVAGLLEQLARWRKPLAVHDPAKMILHFSSEELRAQPSSRGMVAARNDVDGGDRPRSAEFSTRFAKVLRGMKQSLSQ